MNSDEIEGKGSSINVHFIYDHDNVYALIDKLCKMFHQFKSKFISQTTIKSH